MHRDRSCQREGRTEKTDERAEVGQLDAEQSVCTSLPPCIASCLSAWQKVAVTDYQKVEPAVACTNQT